MALTPTAKLILENKWNSYLADGGAANFAHLQISKKGSEDYQKAMDTIQEGMEGEYELSHPRELVERFVEEKLKETSADITP